MKTVVIMSHSYYKDSRVNKALFEAAKSVDNVEVRHLEEIYGTDTSKIDVATEQKILENADRVVFQFPLFWFGMPPMLKAYVDLVFAHGWAYGTGGDKLKGKQFQIAVSSGVAEAEYSKQGKVALAYDELLLPLQTTGGYCGMNINKIFVSGGALNASDDDIKNYADKYVTLLKN
ncbi:flavodoxin-like fold domain protein, putative NAD(P)H (quinone) dehydrogenase/reductase [Campylobacter pinnipediorum subsp. caledonicus]|uniref:NAD(P)H-dependent oxidoreductase n=1 Tax=Campylobacter pinnipediorum TaxID=1965231 RepID=UPI0009957538|nr:NAD(P)H-dependent oxidoreductase [Campylobacter pinnipediorum]AQW86688.1 flavodoxin-like fold domain protein, putative NAD(P)H (quinone) dehydrogenase/reductase [Campylobacter pinnipediorum subsp. caledonicus]